jgi:F-type H+-transporting ATPase subunit delta
MSAQARPRDYAAAIYDLAFEPWIRQLGNVQQVVRTNAALRAVLDDPARSSREKLSLLGQATSGGLDDEVRKFLGTLLEAEQFDQLDAVLVEFERLVRRRAELRLARVTSAVALTDREQESLRAKLVDRFGSDLEFQFNVDATLLGGVYVRVGDQVIDGSVAGKLASLRDRLTA